MANEIKTRPIHPAPKDRIRSPESEGVGELNSTTPTREQIYTPPVDRENTTFESIRGGTNAPLRSVLSFLC
ncbi:MAG: hypothetical protein ABIE74_03870 [Pseudomonadota bacterium]